MLYANTLTTPKPSPKQLTSGSCPKVCEPSTSKNSLTLELTNMKTSVVELAPILLDSRSGTTARVLTPACTNGSWVVYSASTVLGHLTILSMLDDTSEPRTRRLRCRLSLD